MIYDVIVTSYGKPEVTMTDYAAEAGREPDAADPSPATADRLMTAESRALVCGQLSLFRLYDSEREASLPRVEVR